MGEKDWIIKKGNVFVCIQDVRMRDNNELVYRKGVIYKSEQDECITNDNGYKAHYWQETSCGWTNYFKRFNHKKNDLKKDEENKIK